MTGATSTPAPALAPAPTVAHTSALQSALVFNDTARLRAAVAQCPAMFLDVPAFAPRPAEPDAGAVGG